MKKIIFFIILMTFIIPNIMFCQFKLSGKVINHNKKPVDLLEVVLISKEQNKAMKNCLTDNSGFFDISSKEDIYVIEIKQNSKNLYTKEINLNMDIDLGLIEVETIEMLKEVSIKNEKKLIDFKGDKLIFNVENSISSSSGTAIDVLKATPSIIVQENSISMIGKSEVGIMINNRVVQLSGEDLISMLKSINSENVSKIEVISSPSAKYDAEGNGGLVNIVLKKAKNNSYNGNLKSSYTQAVYGTENIGGGLNYQKNKLTVLSNIDFSKGIISPIQTYDIYYPNYTWNEEYKNKNKRDINNQRLFVDYKTSKKTIMGFEFNRISNASKIEGNNQSKIHRLQLDSIIETISSKKINRMTNTYNFHSVSTLDTLGRSISFDADYLKYKYSINNDFNIKTILPSGILKPNSEIKSNNSGNQDISIFSAKIDFTLPLNWLELNMGVKTSILENDNNNLFFNLSNNQYIIDYSKSNHFIYKENNNALYLSAEKNITKKIYLQFGLRLEQTNLKSILKELEQTYKNDYLELFPSIFISYKNDKKVLLSFSYNRRIERPAYNLLNPFRVYTTNVNYSSGNPYLSPYFSNNFKVSVAKGNFNHAIFFNYINNGIDQVTLIEENQNAQITTPLNFFTNKKIGFFENYNFQKAKFWQSNNNLNIYYSQTNSKLKETEPIIKGWTGYFSSNNSLNLNKSKSFKGELNFMFQTSSVSNSYISSSFYNLDLGFRYSILNNNLQFSVNINDILKSSGITFYNNINNIVQNKYNYSDNQKIRFGIVYKFGKTFKESKREFSNEDEKNRVK